MELDAEDVQTIFGVLQPEEEEILIQELDKEHGSATTKKLKKFFRSKEPRASKEENGGKEDKEIVRGLADILGGSEDKASSVLSWCRRIIADMQQIGEEMENERENEDNDVSGGTTAGNPEETVNVNLSRGNPTSQSVFSGAGPTSNLFSAAIGSVNKQSRNVLNGITGTTTATANGGGSHGSTSGSGVHHQHQAGSNGGGIQLTAGANSGLGGRRRPSRSRSREKVTLKRRRSTGGVSGQGHQEPEPGYDMSEESDGDAVSEISVDRGRDAGRGREAKEQIRAGPQESTPKLTTAANAKRLRYHQEDSGAEASDQEAHNVPAKKEKKGKKEKRDKTREKKEKKGKKDKKRKEDGKKERAVDPGAVVHVANGDNGPQQIMLGNGFAMHGLPVVMSGSPQMQVESSSGVPPGTVFIQSTTTPAIATERPAGELSYVQPHIVPSPPTTGGGPGKGGKWRLKKWKAAQADIIVRETKELGSKETKKLRAGEIVEQTGREEYVEVPTGAGTKGYVTRMPITHPSAKQYPEPIGWVTLSAKNLGGPEYFVEGPASVETSGKGKKSKKPTVPWYAQQQQQHHSSWHSGGKYNSWGAPPAKTPWKGAGKKQTYNKNAPKGNLTWTAEKNADSGGVAAGGGTAGGGVGQGGSNTAGGAQGGATGGE